MRKGRATRTTNLRRAATSVSRNSRPSFSSQPRAMGSRMASMVLNSPEFRLMGDSPVADYTLARAVPQAAPGHSQITRSVRPGIGVDGAVVVMAFDPGHLPLFFDDLQPKIRDLGEMEIVLAYGEHPHFRAVLPLVEQAAV